MKGGIYMSRHEKIVWKPKEQKCKQVLVDGSLQVGSFVATTMCSLTPLATYIAFSGPPRLLSSFHSPAEWMTWLMTFL